MISKETTKEADAREKAYSVLALAFYPPSNEARRVWEDVRLLLDALHTDRESDEHDGVAPSSVDLQSLEREYNRLFVGPGHVPCPPYESVYVGDGRGGEKGLVLGPPSKDVMAAYREAGLGLAEGFTDLPDHVAVELEFMKYLCGKESGAPEKSGATWRGREAAFIREHLETWTSSFADAVKKSTANQFYGAAAELLKEFVAGEADTVSDEPGE